MLASKTTSFSLTLKGAGQASSQPSGRAWGCQNLGRAKKETIESGRTGNWVLNIAIIIIMIVTEQSLVFKHCSKSLCILSHLNATILKSRYCYCPQLTNEKTEAREIERLAQRLRDLSACGWWRQDSNPVSQTIEGFAHSKCLPVYELLNHTSPAPVFLKQYVKIFLIWEGKTYFELGFQTFIIQKEI